MLVRLVDPPAALLPQRWNVILSRGPYSYAGERKILTDHGIDVILTKDSGGTHTVAKLDAAGDLGIPVVIIARPEPPPVPASQDGRRSRGLVSLPSTTCDSWDDRSHEVDSEAGGERRSAGDRDVDPE